VKVAVIGATGQLGIDVSEEFVRYGDEVRQLSHSDIELSSLESIRDVFRVEPPDIIVNTAAMHHVESCEKDPCKAYLVNAIGSRDLAIVARDLGIVLVHISTDYVFDGLKNEPYVESDLALPLNVYGNTKLAGEGFIRATAPRHFILRTSALYGRNPCRAKGGRNFVDLMMKLATERGEVRVLDDEFVSPTSTVELASQIVSLSRTDHYGLFHATAEGSCSWHALAKKIFELNGTRVKLMVAAPDEFPAKIPRPKYSVLENTRLKNLGLNKFRPWEEALRSYLASTPDVGRATTTTA
jgi:dTDP-4-dehydrorhamnose reductase